MRRWWRTAVAVSAVAVGLGATIFIVALSRGMIEQMTDTAVRTRLGHVVVHAAGYYDDPAVLRSLPEGGRSILEMVRSWEGLAAAPRLQGDGLVQSARQSARVVLLGVEPDAEPGVSSVPASLGEGTFLGAATESRARRSRLAPIVIGGRMAERLGVSLGDKVVVHVPGELGLGAFRVGGIYRTASSEFDGSVAFLRLSDAQALFDVGDRITEVTFVLERPEQASLLQSRLRAALEGSPVEVLRWQDRQPILAQMLDLMANMYWIFYAAVFVAMAFGIANVQLMAVYERIPEFGMLRAMGLRARTLVALVLLESFLLTMLGTAAGIGVGLGIVARFGESGLDLAWFSEGLRAYGIGSAIRPRVAWGEVLSPAAIATATALLAGLAPALRAARLRPAEALRHL